MFSLKQEKAKAAALNVIIQIYLAFWGGDSG